MKKTAWIVIIILGACLVLFLWFKGSYNSMVSRHEGLKAQAGNVDNQYKRRSDLIPNLVSTVKGYASHEERTLTEVTQARAQATQVKLDISDPKALEAYNNAQGAVNSALSRLLAVAESYPDLKANQNFLDLQTQLEGTENRIAVERRRYNEVAQEYNTYIRSFPRNLIAGMFGFTPAAYFEASEAEREVPKVEF